MPNRKRTRGRIIVNIPIRAVRQTKFGPVEEIVGYRQETQTKVPVYVTRDEKIVYSVDTVGTVKKDERKPTPPIVRRKDNPKLWHENQRRYKRVAA